MAGTEEPSRSTFKSQIITKVGVSARFGLVAFGLSAVLDAKTSESVLLGIGVSVFVSGVAFLTQFLIEVDQRVGDARAGLRGLEMQVGVLFGDDEE